MRRYHIKISAGGVLLLAALYFFMDARDFIALLLAAAAHECGHLAALRAAGCRIRGFSADAGGAVIERRGGAGPGWELICLAAGPLRDSSTLSRPRWRAGHWGAGCCSAPRA